MLHAQLGPYGGCIPPSSKDSSASKSDPLGLRSDSLAPKGRISASGAAAGERDAYAEFQTLGKLPDDLLDSPKSKQTSAAKPKEWHERCQAGSVTEGDLGAVKSFVDSFETVRDFSSFAVVFFPE